MLGGHQRSDKPTNLGCKSTCQLLSVHSNHHIYYNYSDQSSSDSTVPCWVDLGIALRVRSLFSMLLTRHPLNGLFSKTSWVSRHMIRWQWHQLDHMQIICTLLQTDNHASTLSLNFLQARCSSWCPTNSVKALNVTNHHYHQAVTRPIHAKLVTSPDQTGQVGPHFKLSCKLNIFLIIAKYIWYMNGYIQVHVVYIWCKCRTL